MRELLLFVIFAFSFLFLMAYCESKLHPYEFGSHADYQIVCENGYVYKILSHRKGVIQILNKDGSPKTCNELKKEVEIWKANKK